MLSGAAQQDRLGGVSGGRFRTVALPQPRDNHLERRRIALEPSGGTDAGEVLPELGTGQDVDEKVHRRVTDGHHVADGRVVVVPLAAGGAQGLVEHRPEDVIDERRRLADDEREHDDDEDEGDVGLVSGARRDAHLAAPTRLALERADQIRVEDGERQHRSAEHHDEVEDVGVDDPVDGVAAERAHLEYLARLVEADADLDCLVLEESRNVVQHGEQCHIDHVTSHLPQQPTIRPIIQDGLRSPSVDVDAFATPTAC